MKRYWLIEKRIKHSMNQIQLARACGVSNKTISAIENGRKNPSLKLALKLSKVLRFDVSMFHQEPKKTA